ncbi:MAG: DMT family transporter [Actinomycetota bacterium]|nr:DMT family transporter [Actinomycetota bacterium]
MRRHPLPILLGTVIVLWGGAFVAIRIVVRDASPLTVGFLRFVLTSAGLIAVTAVVRPPKRPLERADWPKILLLGVCGVGVYHLSLNYGEQFVSADLASLIVASMPVMVALLSRAVLQEDVNVTRWAGIGIALAGVVVLIFLGTGGEHIRVESLTGAAVVVLAPTAWAIYTVVSKPLVAKYGALRLTTIAMVTGTVLIAPAGIPAAISDAGRLTLSDWGWLAFLAFGCSTYAYTIWFYALGLMPASSLAPWVYLVPIASISWAAIVLGERVTPFLAVGGAMVLGGVFLAERIAPRSSSGTGPGAAAPEPQPKKTSATR